MSNEVAAALSGLRGSRREVGADELTQGLLLVRASAIKLVRFQLAMERHDRRTALEAVDDLVVLDRKIGDFLSEVPGSSESLFALERELEEERRALVREKFTLAAGTARRLAGPGGAASNGNGDLPLDTRAGDELVLNGPLELGPLEDPFIDVRRPGGSRFSSRLLAAGLMFVLLALAFGTWLFLSGSGAAFLQGVIS